MFANLQGLKQVGSATYVSTPQAGLAITGEAGKNGMGGILGQSRKVERRSDRRTRRADHRAAQFPGQRQVDRNRIVADVDDHQHPQLRWTG